MFCLLFSMRRERARARAREREREREREVRAKKKGKKRARESEKVERFGGRGKKEKTHRVVDEARIVEELEQLADEPRVRDHHIVVGGLPPPGLAQLLGLGVRAEVHVRRVEPDEEGLAGVLKEFFFSSSLSEVLILSFFLLRGSHFFEEKKKVEKRLLQKLPLFVPRAFFTASEAREANQQLFDSRERRKESKNLNSPWRAS